MGYAIELMIGDWEAKRIREAFFTPGSLLAEIGASPHVSFAVFNEVDVGALIRIVGDSVTRVPPFRLRFSSVGLFPGHEGVVFLAPVVTEELLRFHADLHGRLAGENFFCDADYLPGRWVPHCTLSMERPLDRVSADMVRASTAGLLGEYTADRVEVVHFRPVVSLARFALEGGRPKV